MTRGPGLGLVAAGTTLIACTYGLARYGYGLFLPAFRDEFALSVTLAGLLATGAFGSYCAAALLSAHLVRRGRARRAAALAGGLAAGGCLAVALAPSAPTLAAAVLVAGSGAGLASPALVALVQRGVPGPDRARSQTVVNAGTGLGVLVSGPVALALADRWRVAWLCFAALSLAATIATLQTAPAGRDPVAPDRDTRAAPRRSWSVPSVLRPAVVAALLVGVGSAGVWTFGRDLVVGAGDLGPRAATLFWVLLGAAGILGAVAGDAVRRWDVPRTWAGCAVTLAGATTGLAVWPGVPPAAFLCGAAFGASYVALSGVVIAWGTQLDPESPGAANAVLFLALAAGQAVGAFLLGGLAELTDLRVAFLGAALVTLLSCLPAGHRPGPVGATSVHKTAHVTPEKHSRHMRGLVNESGSHRQ